MEYKNFTPADITSAAQNQQHVLYVDESFSIEPEGGRAFEDFSLGENQQLRKEKLPIVVNQERVDEVLGELLKTYLARQYPYSMDKVRVPQDTRHMPESLPLGGVEHAMFLWTSCYYMRGGVKSVEAFKRLSRLYEESPELFTPSVAKDVAPDDIAVALSRHGLGFQKTISKSWNENARRLHEQYEGDPRKIFDGVKTYEDALARVMNDGKGGGFMGFREKMTSMIAYYLLDQKLIEPFDFPIPVDLHVMRVSIANGLITFPDVEHGTNLYRPETTEALRSLYLDYAQRHDVSPLDLCNAVWLFSESMCGYQPGNITLEPDGRGQRRGRETTLVPLEIDPYNRAQQAAFARTCGSCVISKFCKYNVPGKPYYVHSQLAVRGERFNFDDVQARLF